MQRSASPDITEGPPSEPRRPGRPRKIQPDANNISSTSSTNLESTTNKATESPEANTIQPVKRGRGRPKRNSEPVETPRSPNLQTTPTIPTLPTSTSSAPPQQPKRRGRKPKAALENPELVDTDRQDAGVDDLAMDTTSDMAPNSCTPMDTDEVKQETSGLNFFSSVLKSEPIFGQLGGSGIPGLDLDEGEANISTGSSEPLAPMPITTPISSFIFARTSSAGIDEECKNLQQLSITKVDEGTKPPSSSENVKKEEASNEDNDNSKVRRSSRIKTLEEQRGSRGRRREVVSSLSDSSGISRSSLSLHEDDSNSNSSTSMQYSGTSGYSSPSGDGNGLSNSSSTPNLSSLSSSGGNGKPEKLKSRWRYSLDAEKTYPGGDTGHGILESCMAPIVADSLILVNNLVKRRGHLAFDGTDDELQDKLKKFEGIDESIYRTERKISKENRGMVCDCYLSNEDIAQGEYGCSDDCLNRLLMVECGNRCPTAENCSNKRFQKKEYASLEVFKTEKKGHGLRTLQYIPEGGFVIEYVGEVLDVTQFERRTNEYAKGNHEHFYFMALKSDAIIDATLRGNCSRFINHSCEPNCETQKWTVNGELRIGFFAITDLQPGDEITFDYQFQRYGKNAQRCFCGTESCRGWIGEEDDESPEDADAEEEEKEEEVALETETAEDRQAVEVKPKVKVERKKRKNVQLEDMAFREELAKLEASGLKNRNHTLTLSRLMVRAESWDDRERLLKILINGEQPCRRLFLDYHGLRLIWSWMVDLPLPHESERPQLIRNDVYHMLFLQALRCLPIPNKSLLLESKVLALVEKWCSAPLVTTTVTLVKGTATSEPKQVEVETSNNAAEAVKVEFQVEMMDTSDIKEEPTSTADGMQEIVEEKNWHFVPISKSLLDSWAQLKEVFRIPKKERVEQMKEHEREADKGQVSTNLGSGFSSNSSYDRDHRNKYRNRDERRVPVLDSTQPKFHRYQNRQVIPPGVSKEEWRKHFEQSVRQREEQEMLRKQQDALVTLHQERCALVGLDPATTPIVDPHGVHYLDPKTVMWKTIDIEDPDLPPELIKFVQLSQYPPQTESIEANPAVTVDVPVEPQEAFPPWPSGLPPPPPLPPAELPKNWKMAVDDEGRCYYYHIRTRVTRWDPPTPEEASSSDSSESSSEEEEVVEEIVQEGSPSISKSKMITKSSKKLEKAARRKKAGLVQERIISPRADDEKGFSKEMVKENKKKVLEEKLAARQAIKEAQHAATREKISVSEEDATKVEVLVEKKSAGGKSDKSETVPKKSSSSMKKKRKERQNPSKGSSSSSGAHKPKPTSVKKGEEGENIESSSPIETELDLTLSQQNFEEENDGFFSRVSTGPSRIIGSTPSMDVVMIPGLGFDSRDLDAKKKAADRAARHAAKKKAAALAVQKKVKEKVPIEPSTSGGSSGDKRVSSKEASHIKDTFRSNVASVVVAHLNAYRKNEHIKTNDDFKHLARKITHTILLKELKHTRDVTSLEVTDSVKHKTKEYIKKFMGRFPNGVYVRSPENPQAK